MYPGGVGVSKTNLSVQITSGIMSDTIAVTNLLVIIVNAGFRSAVVANAGMCHVGLIHFAVFVGTTVYLIARVNNWKNRKKPNPFDFS